MALDLTFDGLTGREGVQVGFTGVIAVLGRGAVVELMVFPFQGTLRVEVQARSVRVQDAPAFRHLNPPIGFRAKTRRAVSLPKGCQLKAARVPWPMFFRIRSSRPASEG